MSTIIFLKRGWFLVFGDIFNVRVPALVRFAHRPHAYLSVVSGAGSGEGCFSPPRFHGIFNVQGAACVDVPVLCCRCPTLVLKVR